MAHLLALTLARALALAVGFGSFALYMAAFFFPEVHRKHDLAWSGVGLLYAVVLWFGAGQVEGALLLGQITGVALLGWLGWQVLTLRRIKTPIQQQTLPGATSQQITQVALDQAKAAADNFSVSETATAIAGVTSSAIAAARGQSKPPSRSTAPACPIDTSTAQPTRTQTTVEQPAVNQVRSQPSERSATPIATTGKSEQPEQVTSKQAARTAPPAAADATGKNGADEEILQPIISPPVESTPVITSQASPIAEPEAAADEEWGNWVEDEDFGDSTAETVTVASVQADTVNQPPPTVDRSAFDTAQTSAPVGQSTAQSQNQSKSRLGLLTAWVGGLLPFGKKKKSQPMVTLPPRDSSLPRSQNAVTPKSSQPMLTIPRRESSLRRPSPPAPDTATAQPSTVDQEINESAIAPDLSTTPILSDDANDITVNPDAVTNTSANQTSQPSPEEILIPEPLPSDEEAWGRFSAIANQEDETLTEAVLIEDAATTDQIASEDSEQAKDAEDAELTDSVHGSKALPDTDLTATPETTDDEVPETLDADDSEVTASEAAKPLGQMDYEEGADDEQMSVVQLSETAPDLQETDQPDHAAATDESESLPAESQSSMATVDIEAEADDQADEDQADKPMTESAESAAEADGEPSHESDNQTDDQPDDHADADDQRDRRLEAEAEANLDPNTDHPALKRPNPPSQELLNDLQRQHYTDAGRE